MTADDLPFDYPAEPESARSTVTPRPCRRHRWESWTSYGDRPAMVSCYYCGKVQDPALSRRGRNNRKRGNALQARAAKAAGIQNIGALSLPEDAGNSRDWLVIQHKSGNGYPLLLDRWLRALTVTADQLRAVVYSETPGPGKGKARRLITCDFDEFVAWFGPTNKVLP